jgi:hypothetical protein
MMIGEVIVGCFICTLIGSFFGCWFGMMWWWRSRKSNAAPTT